jgi:hypothetical protein
MKVCDGCKRNLETREFDERDYCHDCAMKASKNKKQELGMFYGLSSELTEEKVKIQFRKTEGEIKEEKKLHLLVESLVAELKQSIEENDSVLVFKKLEKLTKLLTSNGNVGSTLCDIEFPDFQINNLHNYIIRLVNNKKLEEAHQLAKVYVKLVDKFFEPVPGLAFNLMGFILEKKGEITSALEFYFNSILVMGKDASWEYKGWNTVHIREPPMDDEFIEDYLRAYTYIKSEYSRLKKHTKMIPLYEKEIIKLKKKPVEFNLNLKSISNLIQEINDIYIGKKEKKFFENVDQILGNIPLIEEHINNKKDWKEFIDFFYKLFYENTGNGKRLPNLFWKNDSQLLDNFFVMDIKHLRTDCYHVKDPKDRKRIVEVINKYTKKHSVSELDKNELNQFKKELVINAITFLEKIKGELKNGR